MRTWTRIAGMFFALAVLVAGCAPPPSPTSSQAPGAPSPQRSTALNRVVAGIPSDPPFVYNKLNVGGVGGQGSALQELTHVGLTNYDPRGTLYPRLAEAVPTLDNGLWKLLPDGGMETTWTIRPNATWHDGTPFTAEDLVFTARVVQDRELAVFRHTAYESIESVEAPDSRTIVVTWKRPFIEADAMFAQELAAPLPRHLLEEAYAESKATFTELPYWGREFVGTGPFKVKELERGSHLLVEAFDGYILGRPQIDQIEVRFIADETTLVANILAGTVELTLARALSAEQGGQIREQWNDGKIEITSDDWYVLYPQFIGANPAVITDARFRRALLHGTDRQQIADTLEGRLSSITHAIISPSRPQYKEIEDAIVRYDFDPRRAIQLIENIGLTRGPDGIFRDAANQRIEIEINTTRLDAHQKMLFTLTDQWPRIGVAVDPVVIPPQRAQDAEYRAIFPGFALQGHPAEVIRFHSTEARLPEKNFRGGNNSRYMNPDLDTLIDRYFATIPKQERNQALAQVVRHMTENTVPLPIIWRVDPTAIGNRLQNVMSKGPDATQAWNSHEWDLRG